MRLSQFPIHTTKETPADAEVVSHQLMLRAGYIRKLGAGLYTWMPIGLRVLQKISQIVREEMNAAGAVEMLMPSVHPAELWQESGRWQVMGSELLRMQDRHARDFCYGPTHEEVVCHHVRGDIKSYKQLPLTYYQIQTKFRDEIRPRFGVMRSREFVMKDAYSFHMDAACLQHTYADMRAAYRRIFERIGVEFRIVKADSGNIGGKQSEEFHVLADTGEDLLAVSTVSDYAANVEAAETLPQATAAAPAEAQSTVATPDQRSIEAVAAHLDVAPERCLKFVVVHGAEAGELVALALRGDHELNPLKAEKLPQVAAPLQLASDEQIQSVFGCEPGFLGPVGCSLPVIVDHAAAAMSDFVCGANTNGTHLQGVNWGRDAVLGEVADIRSVQAGDPSPDGEGELRLIRGIEVGHIFQLGNKYTQAMNVTVLDADGREQVPEMGCYGIGVSRVAAAVIEQCHDESGIRWPDAVAPFKVVILPINMQKSERVREEAMSLYESLNRAGIEVLLDDRGQRPGVMFADADLIGIPHRVVIGERGLDAGNYEYKHRGDEDSRDITASLEGLLEAMRPTA